MSAGNFDASTWIVNAILAGRHYAVVAQADGTEGLYCNFLVMPPVSGVDGEDVFPPEPAALTDDQARAVARHLKARVRCRE